MPDLTHEEEHRLYLRDINAWAAYIAPRWIRLLSIDDDAEILSLWRIARPQLKRAVWALASDELKARIRSIAERSPTTKDSTCFSRI